MEGMTCDLNHFFLLTFLYECPVERIQRKHNSSAASGEKVLFLQATVKAESHPR